MTNMKRNISRYFWLAIYYGFARHLPATYIPIIGHISGCLRNICAKHLFLKCGHPINIEHGASFGNGAEMELGNHSCMGIHCHYPSNIKIGNHVMFGPHCHILGNQTHRFDRLDIPIGAQGVFRITTPTCIGDDVWMGRQCLMLPGHTIGNHCVIGAGSVVCKNVPDYSVAAGNPIRVIRDRRDQRKE